jgi:hypothetical protein
VREYGHWILLKDIGSAHLFENRGALSSAEATVHWTKSKLRRRVYYADSRIRNRRRPLASAARRMAPALPRGNGVPQMGGL